MTQDSLPVIPSSWSWAELGDILSGIEAGKSFKCEERPPRDSEVGVVKVSAVTWGTFDEDASKTCLSSERVDPKLFIEPGDFLFSRANTIQLVGACVIVHGLSRRLMLSDKILRLRIHTVVPQWLLYVLRTRWGRAEIERLATGNQESMRNIGQDRIRAIRIPLPPLDEQRRIVAALDEHLTCVELAARSSYSASNRCKLYRRVIANSGLRDAERLAEAGVAVSAVADLIQYGTSEKCSEDSSGIPVLRMGNITIDGRLSTDKLKYLPSVCPEFPQMLLEPGDLLFNRTNSAELVGKSAVYLGSPHPCSFASYLIRVRLKPSCLPQYLAMCLNSDHGRSWIRGCMSQQVGQANVSGRKLAGFEFPLPELDTQRRIMDRVEMQLSALDAIESQISVTQARATRLSHSILKKAFEGKLVPQDPNDEPATIILERIRAARAEAPARGPRGARTV